MIFHSPSRFTVSKASVKFTRVAKRCVRIPSHFACSWRAANTTSVESLLEVSVEASEEDAVEDLPGDVERSNRPEWRSALSAQKLTRHKADIAAVSETCFSEQGRLEEVDAGHTFFWSGHPRAERRNAGVTFAIRNGIAGRLPYLPQGLNDRLTSPSLPLREAHSPPSLASTLQQRPTQAGRRQSSAKTFTSS
ncbi:hypothetical protein SprV_0802474000 [Sparganum proliferum]